MLHPFQSTTFDPGAREVLEKVQVARPLNEGFRIGASAWEVGGDRWILLHHPYPHPIPYKLPEGFFMHLAYPMPACYGEDHYQAMNAFEAHWNAERRRLWALEPPLEVKVPPPPSAPAIPASSSPKHRCTRKGHPTLLVGAVPLPGLEPWVSTRGRR